MSIFPQNLLNEPAALQVVKNEELMEAARKQIKKALQYPDSGRVATKGNYRDNFAQQWAEFSVTEPDSAWKTLSSDETVGVLRGVMDRLRSKRSKL